MFKANFPLIEAARERAKRSIAHNKSEGQTHWACEDRIEKEGGKSRCCECYPHGNCFARTVTLETKEQVLHNTHGVVESDIESMKSVDASFSSQPTKTHCCHDENNACIDCLDGSTWTVSYTANPKPMSEIVEDFERARWRIIFNSLFVVGTAAIGVFFYWLLK